MHNCIDIYVNVYFKRYKFFVQYKTKRYGDRVPQCRDDEQWMIFIKILPKCLTTTAFIFVMNQLQPFINGC